MDKIISSAIKKLENDAILPRLELKPNLLVIHKPDDTAAKSYIKSLRRSAEKYSASIISEACNSMSDATNAILFYKTKPCDGIVIISDYGPGTEQLNDMLPHRLDIDSLSIYSRGALYGNTSFIAYRNAPCTAVAAMKILQECFDNKLCGRKIVIVGRSIRVGRPLAEILLQQDATVSLLHSKSDLQYYFTHMHYDALVSSIGRPRFFNSENLCITKNSEAYLIDVGINVADGKLCGDIDYDDVIDKVPYITPAPNGVGAVTTAVMFAKLYQAKANFLGWY